MTTFFYDAQILAFVLFLRVFQKVQVKRRGRENLKKKRSMKICWIVISEVKQFLQGVSTFDHWSIVSLQQLMYVYVLQCLTSLSHNGQTDLTHVMILESFLNFFSQIKICIRKAVFFSILGNIIYLFYSDYSCEAFIQYPLLHWSVKHIST